MATNIQRGTAAAAEAHHLPAIHMAREVAHLSTPAPRATSQGRRHGSEAHEGRERQIPPPPAANGLCPPTSADGGERG